jgi:hypothetical protein
VRNGLNASEHGGSEAWVDATWCSIMRTIGRRRRFLRCCQREHPGVTRLAWRRCTRSPYSQAYSDVARPTVNGLLYREATVAIRARLRSSFALCDHLSRRSDNTRQSFLSIANPPTPERSFAHAKQFGCIRLAQASPLGPAQDVLRTHPTTSLVNACPAVLAPILRGPTGRPLHELQTPQISS